MIKSFFVTDLHGRINRYESLFKEISARKPEVVFIGGDILPHGFSLDCDYDNFIEEFIFPNFDKLRNKMKDKFPKIYILLGNDDPACNAKYLSKYHETGIWTYIHQKKDLFKGFHIYGYSYVPPSPFRLKDWEKYDVSRFVDPGCIPPEEGIFSINVNKDDLIYVTIQKDIEEMTKNDFEPGKSVFLFHTPPYQSVLDRAALDGVMVDYVPMDVHVGSIAVQRFIAEKQPFLTLHGHIHESTRLTGKWSETFNKTISFNGAHDGKELCLIVFDLQNPSGAERFLI